MTFLRRCFIALLTAAISLTASAYQTTVCFIDDHYSWDRVYAFVWNSSGYDLGGWPGTVMSRATYDGRDAWTITINHDQPFGDEGLIFGNGGSGVEVGNQTVNLPVKANGLYYGSNPTNPSEFDPSKLVIVEDPVVIIGGKPSGTLPVLYINVRNDDGSFNNEVIDKDLAHKNYFAGEYWLDVNGCQWLIDEGAASVGSEEEPLPLEIKARGNYTCKAFAKKPFKLKLGKKQNLLGLTPEKSKHYAILAHADDWRGYLRNFVGFNLGRRIGLPWTPWQQPVEVVINGDYRGLYFLTESIRVGDGRVPVATLDDNVSDPALVSGGYLVELDNYDEENQISMEEKSCVGGHWLDRLRVTFDTPELYSDLQRRFITDQFTAMNDAVGRANVSDDLWGYMDLDDAARYYLVEEIISHVESYHGSTYLFRDRGEGMKWHFSPLWDCGNAFNGSTDRFFYDCDPFGNTWIPSIRANAKFNARVVETWKWFMTNEYDGLMADIDNYVDHITAAARADHKRWDNAPEPAGGQAVANNSDMQSCRNGVVDHLNGKINWLKTQFGDFTVGGPYDEPARDETPAVALPSYAREPDPSRVVTLYFVDEHPNPWEQPHAYIWGENSQAGGNYEVLGTWPGTQMELPLSRGAQTWILTFEPEHQLEGTSRVIFNNGSSGDENETASFEVKNGATYNRNGMTSAIDEISGDSNEAVRYYNLQGIEVADPAPGSLYIRHQGSTVSKVIL